MPLGIYEMTESAACQAGQAGSCARPASCIYRPHRLYRCCILFYSRHTCPPAFPLARASLKPALTTKDAHLFPHRPHRLYRCCILLYSRHTCLPLLLLDLVIFAIVFLHRKATGAIARWITIRELSIEPVARLGRKRPGVRRRRSMKRSSPCRQSIH
jgi:hypothetical protein